MSEERGAAVAAEQGKANIADALGRTPVTPPGRHVPRECGGGDQSISRSPTKQGPAAYERGSLLYLDGILQAIGCGRSLEPVVGGVLGRLRLSHRDSAAGGAAVGAPGGEAHTGLTWNRCPSV
eukprot:GHVU01098659.1.p2 GENE.GHVU01098659.1~~GHVU01098659.1.p2  ORF type:complete len:123 (+),score=4.74 GHVU01098659.1:1256-1624(+)